MPVSPRRSRSASSSVTRVSSRSCWDLPLTRTVTATPGTVPWVPPRGRVGSMGRSMPKSPRFAAVGPGQQSRRYHDTLAANTPHTARMPRDSARNQGAEPRPSAPDLLGGLDDAAELGDLLVVGEQVALDRGGEAALRRQAELLQGHEAAGLVDAPLQLVLGFELAALGGDQAEHHQLALRHEAERLEAAGAGVVVLEEEA